MRTFATTLRSWSPGSPRLAASRNARRRTSIPLLEPLEERWLLDGQLAYGDFGGDCRPSYRLTCAVYSAIGMGGAMDLALALIGMGSGSAPGSGQTQDGELPPEGEPLLIPPADLQQLGPTFSPEQLAPLPVVLAAAPHAPVLPEDVLDAVARSVTAKPAALVTAPF